MAKKKEPQIDIKACTLPELATELQRRFKKMDDSRYYVDCGCDEYCYHDGHQAIYIDDLDAVQAAIAEFVTRMERVG